MANEPNPVEQDSEEVIDREMYDRLGVPLPEPKVKPSSSNAPAPSDPPAGEKDKPSDPPPPIVEETDDELIAKLNKRGVAVKSLSELMQPATPPTETEEQKQRRIAKERLKFGVDNIENFQAIHESYTRDASKPARQLLWEEYLEKNKASGKSEEKLSLQFDRLWFLDIADDASEDDREAAAIRQEEMKQVADRLLKKKYPEMTSLGKQYEDHVATENAKRAEEEEVFSVAKTYKTDLETITTGLTKLSFKIGTDNDPTNDEDVDFEFTPEIVEQVKKQFLTVDTLKPFIGNYSKEKLEAAFISALKNASFDAAVKHTAKEYHRKQAEKMKIGRKKLDEKPPLGAGDEIERDEEMYARLAQFIPKTEGQPA